MSYGKCQHEKDIGVHCEPCAKLYGTLDGLREQLAAARAEVEHWKRQFEDYASAAATIAEKLVERDRLLQEAREMIQTLRHSLLIIPETAPTLDRARAFLAKLDGRGK